MGGSPSNDDTGGANIPTSREEYEEAVGGYTPDTSKNNYSNSSALGADEDLAFENDIFSSPSTDGSQGGGYFDAFGDFPDYDDGDDLVESNKSMGLEDDVESQANYANEGGWQSGDPVPEPGVYNYYNNTYTVGGKIVSKAEYDANQAKREDFLNVASDPSKRDYEDAYAAESLRSDGKDYRDNDNNEDYNTYKSQAQDYYTDNLITNAKLNEVMNDPTYQKLDYSTQENIKSGLASNNKQMQIDAVRAVGEYFGDSRRQDSPESRQMLSSLFGGVGNINQMQGYGQLSGAEYAQALVDGFNQGSGVDLPGLGTGFDLPGEIFDFGGIKAFQGIGGTKMSIDENGNINVQSGGNALGSDAANVALGIGGAKFGPLGSAVTAGLNPQFGKIGLNDYLGANGLLGSKTNSLTFNPAAAITGVASNKVFGDMAPGLAKKVFEGSGGNMDLTKGALVAGNMLTNEAIGKAVESLDLGTLDLLGGGSSTPTGGGNVKSNVNVSSSGETASVQSDLASGSGTSPDAAGETQLSQNLTSSKQSSTGGNDDGGGGQDAASDFLKAMPETLDVNTLQNLNPTNTTPLTTMNNDASLMMNSISPTFGGRYLQRGRNRDTGSVTTRRATQREVDRDKRRSGILFG